MGRSAVWRKVLLRDDSSPSVGSRPRLVTRSSSSRDAHDARAPLDSAVRNCVSEPLSPVESVPTSLTCQEFSS